MHPQLTPTETARGILADGRGTGRVTVLFQAEAIAVDDNGYTVIASIQDWVELPEEAVGSEEFLIQLDLIVSERHPGWELMNWVVMTPEWQIENF